MKSHMASKNAMHGDGGMVEASDGTLVPVAEKGNLYSDTDLRFMLLRHWSLYDAMFFSPFVASRLAVWKSHGKEKLQTLFAKLGVSLEQCKQKWVHMNDKCRRRVEHMLSVVSRSPTDFKNKKKCGLSIYLSIYLSIIEGQFGFSTPMDGLRFFSFFLGRDCLLVRLID